MEYREFLSLTDDEIRFIIDDIIKPFKIGAIKREDENTIDVEVYLMEDYPDFADTVSMSKDGEMETRDFEFTSEEKNKWKQFLFSRGCVEELKDNTYMETHRVLVTTENGVKKKVCTNCGQDLTKLTTLMIPKYCVSCGVKFSQEEGS